MKRLAILGSTGSIGRSTLSLVDLYPDYLSVVSLAARSNSDLLFQQCLKYRPEVVSLLDPAAASELDGRLPNTRVLSGPEGLNEVARHPKASAVVSAVSGAVGLVPTYYAILDGKFIALANKETLVMSGDLLMPLARLQNSSILPVDSEHSALHQCLRGTAPSEVETLILTASGGPFLGRTANDLERVTIEEALDHPTWEMGRKITIDSATLMNKGLEVIEAHHFFGVPPERIRVVVHPQSVIHSLVEFTDGTMLAQMSITDMRSCLLYALAYPERWPSRLPRLQLTALPPLSFQAPDHQRFPCLSLAYRALDGGKTFPTVLNAANEVAVEAFLEGRISFGNIPSLIEATLEKHRPTPISDLETVLEADREARRLAYDLADGLEMREHPS